MTAAEHCRSQAPCCLPKYSVPHPAGDEAREFIAWREKEREASFLHHCCRIQNVGCEGLASQTLQAQGCAFTQSQTHTRYCACLDLSSRPSQAQANSAAGLDSSSKCVLHVCRLPGASCMCILICGEALPACSAPSAPRHAWAKGKPESYPPVRIYRHAHYEHCMMHKQMQEQAHAVT